MITKLLSYPKRPTELGAIITGVRVVVQRMIVSPRAQSASLVGNDDDLLLNDTNNSTANRGWEEPGFFQHPLGQKKRLIVVILATRPSFASALMLQVQPVSRRNPPRSISPRTSGKFPCANPSPGKIYLCWEE